MIDFIDTATIFKQPEHALLLHAMLYLNEPSASKLTIHNNEIDWSYLLEMAERHGLTPLLYHFFQKNRELDAPEEVLNILHDRYKANKLRNRILTQELSAILDLFNTNSIRALAYKGPSLTLSVYGDLGLRQFSDLDILISVDDVPEACELLTRQGYSRTLPFFSPSKEKVFIRMHHEHVFISTDQLVHVDLHWALSTRRFPFELKPDGLFERAESLSLANGHIQTISAQDMLLLLCMHINKDLWRKLIWVCDIDRLVRTTKDIDWDSLLQQSVSSHCNRMLHLSLLIAHELLRTPVPDSVLQVARTQGLVGQGQIALRLCLRKEMPVRNYLQCLAIEKFILSLCDNYNDRFKYVMRGLVKPSESDMIRFNLPKYLYFIYYLITPVRMLFFCTARFFKRLIMN